MSLANISAGEGSQTFEYDWTPFLKVTLDHFYGIEIDEWASENRRDGHVSHRPSSVTSR